MKSFTEHLDWRFAAKGFKQGATIGHDKMSGILDAIVKAPTSFGLQPFYVKAVKDMATKEKLKAAGWNQNQFTSAEVVLVFVARADIKNRIDEFVHLIKTKDPERAKSIDGYEKVMRGSLESKSPADLTVWASRQAYIALGFAMAACAELEVHSCPMEGFLTEEFNKILQLPSDHHAVVSLAIGELDPAQSHLPKLRFDRKDLIRTV